MESNFEFVQRTKLKCVYDLIIEFENSILDTAELFQTKASKIVSVLFNEVYKNKILPKNTYNTIVHFKSELKNESTLIPPWFYHSFHYLQNTALFYLSKDEENYEKLNNNFSMDSLAIRIVSFSSLYNLIVYFLSFDYLEFKIPPFNEKYYFYLEKTKSE